MLTPGDRKLGADLVRGFGLPSGDRAVCVGMTAVCRRHCYAVRTEQYRRHAAAESAADPALAGRPDSARRVRAFLAAPVARVVRVHTGGGFFSARSAWRWRRVVARPPRVRFSADARAWRVPAVRAAADEIAAPPNARVWYACDRGTGVPDAVPDRVRVARPTADEGAAPPVGSGLVVRVERLRSRSSAAADGVARAATPTCDHCRCAGGGGPRRPAGTR